jgi:hypothetical protein
MGGGGWGDRERDEPSTQALPIRNGHGNSPTPGNGKTAGDGAEPRNPAAPGGPAKLPAFTGLSSQGPQFPIGSQNIHGSDGPSASGPVGGSSPANGMPGGATNGLGGQGAQGAQGAQGTQDAQGGQGSQGGNGADEPGTGSGQVTIPPAGQEHRLPIFDSLESDWFRRSGQTLATTSRAPAAQSAGSAGSGAPGGPGATWTSPADEGWRAAQAVASPEAGETTQAGLPRRVPRANLVPGSVGSGGGQEPEAEAPARSADAIRNRMASFQRGVREGRAVAPQTTEEP